MAMTKRPKVEELTEDGLQNLVTGLGEYGKDKRESNWFTVDLLGYPDLESVYRGSDLAAKVVDLMPDDMTRECAEICIPDDDDSAEMIEARLEELETNEAMTQALKWRNAFGGAVILVGANDGATDLSQPLNEKAIRSIDYLNVFDAWEAKPIAWQENPLKKDFARPTMFQLNPHSVGMGLKALQNVHASRCLVFNGPMASRRQVRDSSSGLTGWGDSRLVRCVKLIRDYDAAWGGVASTLQEFVLTIFKIKGFANALLADKDKALRRRFQAIRLAQSMVKATIADADKEDIVRTGTPMSGVPEALREFQARMAAAADMPVNKLFGTSTGGLNSTGQAEERMWYDVVRARQHRDLAPQWRRLVKLTMLAKDSPTRGKEPENWSVHFPSLWQPSDVEKAEVRNKNAQTDQIYFNLGVASSTDIAQSRFGGDGYGMELRVDLDAAEQRAETEADLRVTQQETAMANLQKHGQETPPKPAPNPPAK